jgi:hypothetical protein
MAARYDDKARRVTVDPFVAAAAPLGTMSGKLTLTNVPPTLFTTNAQQAQAAAMTIELAELELNLADGGVITLARKIAGPSFAEGIIAGLRQQAAQVSKGAASPEIDALLVNIGQFLAQPGQTVTLRLKPKAAARITDIAAQVMVGGPAALFAVVDVTSGVKR